jgi:hypothetical protein
MAAVNSSSVRAISWGLRLWRSPRFSIALAIFVIMFLAVDMGLLYRAYRSNPYPNWLDSTDFGVYIRAAKDIAQGHDPYIPENCPCYKYYGTTEVRDQVAYPPLFLELILPLIMMGDEIGRFSWLILNIIFLVATLVIILPKRQHKFILIGVGLCFGIIAFSRIGRSDLYHGQSNYLLMLLIAFGLWLWAKKRKVASGISIGLAIAIKPFLGLLSLYFFWKRDYRTAIVCLTTTIILVSLSFAPLVLSNGLSVVQNWRSASAYFTYGDMASRPDNMSLHGLLLRLFSDNLYTIPWVDSALIRLLIEGMLVLGALIIFVTAVPRRIDQFALEEGTHAVFAEVGLLLGLTMSIGPLMEGSHLLLLVPGVVATLSIAIRYVSQQHTSRAIWWWEIASIVVFLIWLTSPVNINVGLPSPYAWTPLTGLSILLTSTVGFYLFAMSILLAQALRRQRKTPGIQSMTG